MTDEIDFWDGFWDGYKEYLNDQNIKQDMSQNLLDNVILDSIMTKGIPNGQCSVIFGKSNQSYIENYTDIFVSKRINELRSENLKKILDDTNQ
jgi:hypothetical protein